MELCLLRGLLSEMRKAQYFSIIADEATDVGRNEKLVVCIRWVDDDPIEPINVPRTDAHALTTCIRNCFLRCCLPISQCRGQAYDGPFTPLPYIWF